MRGLAFVFTLALLCTSLFSNDLAAFERVDSLEPNVAFFRNVYAKWTRNDIILHDPNDLSLVYRVVRVPPRGPTNGFKRKDAIKIAKQELLDALRSLNKMRPTDASGLNAVEKEVFENLAHSHRKDKYALGGRVRIQNGIRERSLEGWISFGRYEKGVRRELRRGGMPEELIALAFLESLYNIRVRSPSNALGMWQFLKPTANEYMNANDFIDERIDPVLATEAATKYLRASRKRLGEWPLAITSYNIGRAGMARGVRMTESQDLGFIVRNYRYRTFGFAARNYYATFLAMLDVVQNPDAFFPNAKREPSWEYDIVRLKDAVKVPTLLRAKVIEEDALKMLNPALLDPVLNGERALPNGFTLRVPKGEKDRVEEKLAKMAKKLRRLESLPLALKHQSDGKMTIKSIARLYRADPDIIAALNGMDLDDVPPTRKEIKIHGETVHFTPLPETRKDIVAAPETPIFVATRQMPNVRVVPTVTIVQKPIKAIAKGFEGSAQISLIKVANVAQDGRAAFSLDFMTDVSHLEIDFMVGGERRNKDDDTSDDHDEDHNPGNEDHIEPVS